MCNVFNKGDTIVINKKAGIVSKPAIYAIEQDSTVLMRGLRKELNNQYTLFVHNKQNYDDQTLTEAEFKNLKIVGKYLGHWQTASN